MEGPEGVGGGWKSSRLEGIRGLQRDGEQAQPTGAVRGTSRAGMTHE